MVHHQMTQATKDKAGILTKRQHMSPGLGSVCCGPPLPTTLPEGKSKYHEICTGWTTDKSKTNRRLGMHTSSRNQEAEAGAWTV